MVLGLDFTHRLGNQPRIRGLNLTRFQRASKGAGESAGGGRYDVIECGGVGLKYSWRHFIVFGHGAVDPERHRRGLGRQPSPPHRPFDALNADK
jgi:hypothetical protein